MWSFFVITFLLGGNRDPRLFEHKQAPVVEAGNKLILTFQTTGHFEPKGVPDSRSRGVLPLSSHLRQITHSLPSRSRMPSRRRPTHLLRLRTPRASKALRLPRCGLLQHRPNEGSHPRLLQEERRGCQQHLQGNNCMFLLNPEPMLIRMLTGA